jgi:hypothetical protein
MIFHLRPDRRPTANSAPVREDPIELPAGVRALGPDVEAAVERLVRDAEHRQDRELDEALTRTLRLVPAPLRGAARKVLLG